MQGTCGVSGTPAEPRVTWGGRDAQHLLAQLGEHLHGVSLGLGVQRLVHLGQDDLTQVEQSCGGRRRRRAEARGLPVLPTPDFKTISPDQTMQMWFFLPALCPHRQSLSPNHRYDQDITGPLPVPTSRGHQGKALTSLGTSHSPLLPKTFRHRLPPVFACRDLMSFSSSSSGMGLPVL